MKKLILLALIAMIIVGCSDPSYEDALKIIREKEEKEILEETPTSIEYSPDERWIYTYKLVELELEMDLRYDARR